MPFIYLNQHDFPAKYRPIIKRLKQAVADKEVREIMELEDEYLKEILDFEKRFAAKNELYLEAKKQKVKLAYHFDVAYSSPVSSYLEICLASKNSIRK